MITYKQLPPDVYYSIKRSITEDFILSQYPSFHDSMLDSFEIVSIDGKISIYYYKNGTLEIQGEDTSPTFRRIVRKTNNLVSKKDYI